MSAQIINGDCRDVLKTLPSASVDAIVTDPPYGLNFMGKKWDYDVPGVDVWRECFRALRPGGHLLSFFGTRTYHRGVVPIEDAGFEIRDQIGWLYGSGFPKSHNMEGDWEGWGTALKPAWEPIVVARKPLDGTNAQNLARWGVGALNIDGCRVELSEGDDPRLGGKGDWSTDKAAKNVYEGGFVGERVASSALGRWPANVIHDGSDEVLDAFPVAPGQLARSSSRERRADQSVYGAMLRGGEVEHEPRDSGGSAARFFYCAKASKSDRDAGLDDAPDRILAMSNQAKAEVARGNMASGNNLGVNNAKVRKNNHPTVKPTDLMRYLCRLVTPPGGTVLDPFMGSGSTGRGAVLEGFNFIGIEMDVDYVAIARARIAAAEPKPELIGVFA